MEFQLTNEDFFYSVTCAKDGGESSSRFDRMLREKWTQAVDAGLCRYRLGNLQTKILPGKYALVAQLNPDRAKQRRAPQDLQCVKAPFNPNEFNFNKANQQEVLFRLGKNNIGDHVVIINVSPLEFGHCLLIPSVQANITQQVTFEGVLLLLKTVLCSANMNLKAGFNSPGGYASVNHQHYHFYYLEQRLFIETANVEHVAGPCYALKDFPSKGYAFQLESDVEELAKNVFTIVSYFRENDVAHNFFVTRGSRFGAAKSHVYDTIRVIVWAREPTFGVKEEVGFNPALCELAGHLLIKEADTFERVTEKEVDDLLNAVTEPWFAQMYDQVRGIFAC